MADRETWIDDPLLPEVPQVGRTTPRHGDRYTLGGHRHVGAYEFCLLRRGSVDWWVGDEVVRVQPGQAYVTRPGELHGGLHDRLQRCDLWWVQVRAGALAGRGGSSSDRAALAALVADLGRLPRVFPAAETQPKWEALLSVYRRRGPHAGLAARAALVALLVALVDAAAAASGAVVHGASAGPSPAVRAAMAAGRRHLESGIAVPGLARAAGLSLSRLHARFVAETGSTPADWLRRERINRAKVLLAGGRRVTDTALSLGFPSSQHFATVFRRYTGVTPRAWTAAIRATAT